LNKPAVVTLLGLFAKDKSGRPSQSQSKIAKFEEKLRKRTQSFEGRFISYDPESGAWKFQVEHFSKYGLGDDDSDDDSDSDDDDDDDGGVQPNGQRVQKSQQRAQQPKGKAVAPSSPQTRKRTTTSTGGRRIVKGRPQVR